MRTLSLLLLLLLLLSSFSNGKIQNCELTQFAVNILPSTDFPYNRPLSENPYPAAGSGYINAFEMSPGVYMPVCGQVTMTAFSFDDNYYPLVNDASGDPVPSDEEMLQTFHLTRPQYVDSFDVTNFFYPTGAGNNQLFDEGGIVFLSEDKKIFLNFYGGDLPFMVYPNVTHGVTGTYVDGDQTVYHNQIGTFVHILTQKVPGTVTCPRKSYEIFKFKVSTYTGAQRHVEERGEEGEGEEGEEGEAGVSDTPPYPVNAHIRLRAVPRFSEGAPQYQVACGSLKINRYTADSNIGASALPFDPVSKHYEVFNPPGLFGGFLSNNILTVPSSRTMINATVEVTDSAPQTFVDFFGLYFRSTDDKTIANLYYQPTTGSSFYVDPFTVIALSSGDVSAYHLNLDVLSNSYGFWFDSTNEFAPNTPVDVDFE